MTWEEQLDALQTLGPASIRMRGLADWYVSMPNLCIAAPGGVQHSAIGFGMTLETAVSHLWEQLTVMPTAQSVVVEPYSRGRRHVRWDGTMWRTIADNN